MTPLKACRLCGSGALATVLSLGEQRLCGTFPKTIDEDLALEKGPLDLMRCMRCELLQLGATYSLEAQYGANYGHRSGLNAGMVRHLREIAQEVTDVADLDSEDVVLDIGSNDGTLLGMLPPNLRRIGMDPTAGKFASYYVAGTEFVPEFFSAPSFLNVTNGRKARAVTSIAMFYDLPDPVSFAKQVRAVLEPGGVWIIEVAYAGTMLQRLMYDGICHEHLEYYGLNQIREILALAGFGVAEASLNDCNGGSLRVVAKPDWNHSSMDCIESAWLSRAAWADFAARVALNRWDLQDTLWRLKRDGKKVLGLGASTKGNTVLQYCGITPDLLPAIAEVNPDKYGSMTPGTRIPIVSEADASKMRPDAYLVLPWHFRDGFELRRPDPDPRGLVARPAMIYPLPEVEVVP